MTPEESLARELLNVANEGVNFSGWNNKYDWSTGDDSIDYDRAAFIYVADFILKTHIEPRDKRIKELEEAINNLDVEAIVRNIKAQFAPEIAWMACMPYTESQDCACVIGRDWETFRNTCGCVCHKRFAELSKAIKQIGESKP